MTADGGIDAARDVADPSTPPRALARRQAVTLSLFRFEGVAARAFAIGRMATARAPLAKDPEIGFFRLFGTGTGEGFSLSPNLGVWAVLATWPSFERARSAMAEHAVFQGYRARAAEHWTLYLGAYASRGRWAGQEPFEISTRAPNGPIAVLTRATIKTSNLAQFWRRTPGISAAVRDQSDLPFKIGMGEFPGRKQVTFSIWRDTETMRRFAYGDGPHADAARAVRDGAWFHEELYARFAILSADGLWEGRDPLADARVDAAGRIDEPTSP